MIALSHLRQNAQLLGGGHHSEVFLWEQRVYKVYRQAGLCDLERQHMLQVGMQDWLLEATESEGFEILVMRAFAGLPVAAHNLAAALPQIQSHLERLHGRLHHPQNQTPQVNPQINLQVNPQVNLEPIRAKLERFSPLRTPDLEPLFLELERALAAGYLQTRSQFCHLDLWADNILVSESGEVLIVDWVRADWDDPMRDIALLKTGTLDLLPRTASLAALEPYLHTPLERLRLRAYLALTYLHDLEWIGKHQTHDLAEMRPIKLERALDALEGL